MLPNCSAFVYDYQDFFIEYLKYIYLFVVFTSLKYSLMCLYCEPLIK